MNFNKDEFLKKVPYDMFKKLSIILNDSQSLRKIKENFPAIFEDEQSAYLSTSLKSPAEQLLTNLINLQCTVDHLNQILRICELYDALSIFVTEKLVIRKQPTENSTNNKFIVKRGNELLLEFLVWGIPQPKYHWYKNGILLPEQDSSKLYFSSYTSNMAGSYYSRAIQTLQNGAVEKVESNIVNIDTLQERCVIIKKPPLQICERANSPECIVLQVVADGYPTPQYQWVFNNTVLANKTTSKLRIKNQKNMEGTYRCTVSNGLNEEMTKTELKIVDNNFVFPVSKNIVSEKVALLVANQMYTNQRKLQTPINDIIALRDKLELLGFLVINVNNLNLNGMKNILKLFSEMCVEGSYVLFYFAGHGFELGDKYLLPVDAPDHTKMGFKNSISENEVLQYLLCKKPKLVVSILDMCLKLPNRVENSGIYEEKPEVFEFESDRNTIRAYSTSTGFNAYELENRKNSVYNNLLLKNLGKLPVLQMLLNVNNDFQKIAERAAINNNKIAEQMPSVTFNISQDYCLDVEKTGHPDSEKYYRFLNR